MAEKLAFKNGRIFNVQELVTLTLLDLGSGHTTYRHASLILYLHAKFHAIEETFCGHTDVCTDRHLRPTLLDRLGRFNLKMTATPYSQTIYMSKQLVKVTGIITHADGSCGDGFLTGICVFLFICTISRTPMQLGSPNLTHSNVQP